MDLNEKLAQRRKERAQEITADEHLKAPVETITHDSSVLQDAAKVSSIPIEDRIKVALNENHDRNMNLKRMAMSRVKPWEWFAIIFGVFVSLSFMIESFFLGALFLGAFVWFAKTVLKKYEVEIVKEWASVVEAKNLMQDIYKNRETPSI
jgi:hypothetical protein